MSKPIPSKARAVIIGGGVTGCSVAYHLAKLGWTDVVLLERKQLTCGTTWHAAGLIGQLRASQNMTRLAKYSADLYVKLEAETGTGTGMKQNGSMTVALTDERKEEIYRQASLARAFNVDEALRKVPGITARSEEGFSQRPNIGVRGLNPTRSSKVLLLEDGLPLSYAPYGDNASYYHPPLDRFSEIEVVKGAGQIPYGPMTVGGVINYRTPPIPSRSPRR